MKKRVVVVSDEPLLVDFVRRPLEPLGHDVLQAESIQALEELAHRAAPDIVLLPRRVPDVDIDAAVARARRLAPPPSLVLCGVDERDRRIAERLGIDAFLLVPFTDAQVLEIVGSADRPKRVVLLADDSPLIHRHTVPILEDDGYVVLQANDGREALDILERGDHVDLVITDVEMPRMDGFALTEAIRSLDTYADTPVIILTSRAGDDDRLRGMRAGADGYLAKSTFSEATLLTAVERLLGR